MRKLDQAGVTSSSETEVASTGSESVVTVAPSLASSILWLVTLAISVVFVMRYAKKVKEDKGSTFLSLQEAEEHHGRAGEAVEASRYHGGGQQQVEGLSWQRQRRRSVRAFLRLPFC